MVCTTVVPIFVSVFLILLARSSLGIERTGRLLINNDPHGLQVEVDHLIQELNALKSDTNREINYLKSQLATQGQEISTCKGNITLESLARSFGWFMSQKRKQHLNLSYFCQAIDLVLNLIIFEWNTFAILWIWIYHFQN